MAIECKRVVERTRWRASDRVQPRAREEANLVKPDDPSGFRRRQNLSDRSQPRSAQAHYPINRQQR